MATLTNRINLDDGVTSVLTRIERAANRVTSAFERMEHAGGLNSVSEHMQSASRQTVGLASGLSQATSEASRLGSVLNSTFGQFALANLASDAIGNLVGKLASLPGQIMDTAQGYAGIESKMRLVVGSQEAVEQMNERIYQAAMRSNASFDAMADSVAKIGLTAKEAFPDPNEIVPFMEGIQKLMVIGGTAGENAKATMLQLTQALGSGVLQGDEFRSIAEQAPLIEKMVAQEMSKQTGEHITQGMLKQLASEGKVTADLVKNAILNNMDEINAQFGNATTTASDRLANIGTVAYKAFIPVFQQINKIFNSEAMGKFVSKIEAVFPIIANEVLYLVNCFGWVAGAIYDTASTFVDLLQASGVVDLIADNLGMIVPVIMGVAAAFVTMKAIALIPTITALWAQVTALYAQAVAAIGSAWATFTLTAATIADIYATEGLTAALYACPLTWIAGAVMFLVIVFYLAVEAINYFADTSISATGIIFGVFAWLFACIQNMIAFAWNSFLAFAQFLANVFVDPLTAAQNFFATMWNNVVQLVAAAVNNIIGLISKIPGMDKVVGGISADGIASSLTVDIQPIAGGVDLSGYQMSYANGGDWFDTGYGLGDALEQKIGNLGNFSIPDIKMPTFDEDEWGNIGFGSDKNGADTGSGAGAGGTGSKGDGSGKKTADNTGRMADKMDMLEEDVKFLREYANQEAIDQYTTATVKISMGGVTNNVSSGLDLDGVISGLADGLVERMQAGAEKVHPV